MNRFDRTLQRIVESFNATESRRVGHGRFETVEPAEGQPLQRARLIAGYVLAVALPAATSAATIPLRGSHTSAAAVILVLSVVVVAAIGTTGWPSPMATTCPPPSRWSSSASSSGCSAAGWPAWPPAIRRVARSFAN
ncbi:MAG: hypothetical protein WBK25_02270 [Candidatus Microthrix parvicella]|jgi:hypothetical protein